MPTKVISFVSFKGGAGRSVTLANVAYQLSKKSRVACVDFDIEGGGLHYIFDVGPGEEQHAIQHFLMGDENYRAFFNEDPPEYHNHDVFKRRLVLDVYGSSNSLRQAREAQRGELLLVYAKPDADLTAYVDTGGNLFHYFNKLLGLLGESFDLDYILIDCRSGISKIGLPGLAYCDLAVVCMRWGIQHRQGTKRLVDWYHGWLQRMEVFPNMILVASDLESKNPQATVEDFCASNLPDVPVESIVVPHLKELETEDKVFMGAATTEEQKPYARIADMIRQDLMD